MQFVRPTHTMLSVFTIFLRLTGPVLTRRLIPLWLALAVSLAVFERSIDFVGWRLWTQTLTPLEFAAYRTGVLASWLFGTRRIIRATLYGAQSRVLWRQPITRTTWGVLLLPFAAVHLAPLCLLGGLERGTTPLLALAWMGLGMPAWAAIGFPGWRGAGWSMPCLLGMGLVSALGQWSPELWAILAPVSICGAVVLTGRLYVELRGLDPWIHPSHHRRWGRRTTFVSIVQRDVLCLWRCERGLLLGGVWLGLPFLLFTYAFARHGGSVATLAAILLSVLSPLSALLILRLEEHLGRHLGLGGWPVGPLERIPSLWCVATLPLTFLVLGALGIGWGFGEWRVLCLLPHTLFVAASQTTVALLGMIHERLRTLMPWMALLCALLSLLPWPLSSLVAILALLLHLMCARGVVAAYRRRIS